MTTKKVHMVLKVVMPWYPQRTDAIVSSRVTVPIEKALRDHVKISSHSRQMLGIWVSAPQSVLRIDVLHDKMAATVKVATASDLVVTGSHVLGESDARSAFFKSENERK